MTRMRNGKERHEALIPLRKASILSTRCRDGKCTLVNALRDPERNGKADSGRASLSIPQCLVYNSRIEGGRNHNNGLEKCKLRNSRFGGQGRPRDVRFGRRDAGAVFCSTVLCNIYAVLCCANTFNHFACAKTSTSESHAMNGASSRMPFPKPCWKEEESAPVRQEKCKLW